MNGGIEKDEIDLVGAGEMEVEGKASLNGMKENLGLKKWRI